MLTVMPCQVKGQEDKIWDRCGAAQTRGSGLAGSGGGLEGMADQPLVFLGRISTPTPPPVGPVPLARHRAALQTFLPPMLPAIPRHPDSTREPAPTLALTLGCRPNEVSKSGRSLWPQLSRVAVGARGWECRLLSDGRGGRVPHVWDRSVFISRSVTFTTNHQPQSHRSWQDPGSQLCIPISARSFVIVLRGVDSLCFDSITPCLSPGRQPSIIPPRCLLCRLWRLPAWVLSQPPGRGGGLLPDAGTRRQGWAWA